MTLQYPTGWKFGELGISIPDLAVDDFLEFIKVIAGKSQSVLEVFKQNFGSTSRSSDFRWAVGDLNDLLLSNSKNAALFVDRLWSGILDVKNTGEQTPDSDHVNKILMEHNVPLGIFPPYLKLTSRDISTKAKKDLTIPSTPYHLNNAAYRLDEIIGNGAFGVVYKVTKETGASVFRYAMKILDPSPFGLDPLKAKSRFQREIEVLNKLQHRSIIQIIEAGFNHENKPYIVMPLVIGQDLRRALSGCDVRTIIWTFWEILNALEYTHQNDVIHRDLKPSNVLVRKSDGQPVILDFGAAYAFDEISSESLTNSLVGTMGYIPSEVLSNPKLRTPGQDIFACGIMLYEILAGVMPDPAEYVPLKTFKTEYAPFDTVVRTAISGARSRYHSARAFKDALDNIHGYFYTPKN